MPTNTLSDARCRAAKAGAKPQKLFDGGGLHLFVSATGSKTWRLAYRFRDKPKTISFGPYPDVSLAEARTRRHAAKATLRDGLDPMVVKRPTAQKSISLSDAAVVYWDGRGDVSDGYAKNAKRGIEMHLCPTIGDRPVREVSRDDLLAALNTVDAAGRHVYVRKIRMWVGQVFEWAIEQGYSRICWMVFNVHVPAKLAINPNAKMACDGSTLAAGCGASARVQALVTFGQPRIEGDVSLGCHDDPFGSG